jgi:hypothetical protein
VDKTYYFNTRFTIRYKENGNSKKAKGYFKGNIGDSLVQFTKKIKSTDTFAIALNKIEILKKTSTIRRKKSALAFAGLGISGGLLANALSTKNTDTLPSRKHNFNYIFAIPFLGAAVYYLYSIPATLIADKINEHKKINGWTFSIN